MFENDVSKRKKRDVFRRILKLIEDKGRPALETASRTILMEKIDNEMVLTALNYYMSDVWFDVHHAGLMSIACEAAGGDPEHTTLLGAATILLRGAIDIHDDIIDQQKMKKEKPTVYGRYGGNIAILTGNALLFEGFALLNNATESFTEKKRREITNQVKNAFFQIGDAVAKEIELRKREGKPLPEEYYTEVIEKKAVGVELHMRIGAIVGCGTERQIESLTSFGRILGILATVRDEFVDMYEPVELHNRVRRECPPLPILYAYLNPPAKKTMDDLFKKRRLSQADAYKILEITFRTEEYQKFREDLKKMEKRALEEIQHLPNKKISDILENLIALSVEDI